MTKFDSQVEADAFRWIEDNRRRVRKSGMTYWNSNKSNIEPETLRIIQDMVVNARGLVTAPDVAPCGCEIDRSGDIHLCEFHLGYDCAVEAMRLEAQDGKEEEEEVKG